MGEEIATPTAEAATPESAPVETTEETPAVNPAESAPAETPSEEDEPKVVQELKAQRKKRQEAEREAAYWRGVAEAGGKVPPAANTVSQQNREAESAVTTAPVAPKLDEFETYAEYEAAKDEYVLQAAEHRVNVRLQAEQNRRQAAQAQDTFTQRLQKAAITEPEILDIAADPTLPISDNMAAVIRESEVAPGLLKHLHNNRAEAMRISKLSPLMAAKELGRLEAVVSAAPKPEPPKRVSQAPEPISTVKPSGSPVVDEDALPMNEWIARRNANQYKRK